MNIFTEKSISIVLVSLGAILFFMSLVRMRQILRQVKDLTFYQFEHYQILTKLYLFGIFCQYINSVVAGNSFGCFNRLSTSKTFCVP